MKVLGYIPARGGSKGLPGKNVKPLGGVPLLGRAIRTASRARSLDRLFVSTDSPRIAAVARRFGVDVPWLRPAAMAKDGSLLIDALEHDLARLEREQGYRPDAVMVLQPTSPFRTAASIEKAVALFRRSGAAVVSVTPARSHPNWCFTVDGRGLLKRLNSGAFVARQKLPPAYALDGSVFLAGTRRLLKDRSFYGGPVRPLVVPPEEAVDIDTPFDFALAAGLLKVGFVR